MAARGVSLKFEAQAPSIAALITHAEQLSGLRLEVVPLSAKAYQLSVPECPGSLEVRQHDAAGLFLFTVDAPTLYLLLWQAATQLGGAPPQPKQLRCPLTIAEVRRQDSADHRGGLLLVVGLISLVGIALAGIALIAELALGIGFF